MIWNKQVYIDGMLPFGLRSAPKIFNAIADAIEWCCVYEGVEYIYHYLDDFAIVGQPESERCGQWLNQLQSVCNDLGVPLAPEKQAGPTTSIEFLGIIIDTVRQEMRLPKDKLERLRRLTAEWHNRKSCIKRDLESLLGILQHACTVITSRRTFI